MRENLSMRISYLEKIIGKDSCEHINKFKKDTTKKSKIIGFSLSTAAGISFVALSSGIGYIFGEERLARHFGAVTSLLGLFAWIPLAGIIGEKVYNKIMYKEFQKFPPYKLTAMREYVNLQAKLYQKDFEAGLAVSIGSRGLI